MADLQIRTALVADARAVPAHAAFELLTAGGYAEVGGRSALVKCNKTKVWDAPNID